MNKKTLGSFLYKMIKEDSFKKQRYVFLEECKGLKIIKLWQIFFETEISEAELLETRIYEFGSMIKEEDTWGREIFVCLVALLNLVIK